jgi:CTP:molybdopterin cytidylyltransferase MocA
MGSGRVVILLAAGASQRMGTPKALLPWRNSTLLEYAIEQARAGGASQVVVVLGPATRHVQVDATTVFNPEPETGRSASIRLAAAAVHSNPSAIIVQSVDQPVVAEILTRLFEAIDEETDVAIPTFEGRRGHPICLAGRLLPELCAVTEEEQGLRSVVRRHADHVREVPTDSESVTWNLNDPAAFAAAQATL